MGGVLDSEGGTHTLQCALEMQDNPNYGCLWQLSIGWEQGRIFVTTQGGVSIPCYPNAPTGNYFPVACPAGAAYAVLPTCDSGSYGLDYGILESVFVE